MAKNNKLVNSIILSFELKCLDLLIISYGSTISENSFSKDWEEESFSAHIVKHIRKFKHNFIVNYEVPLAEEDVYNAKKRVKNSNRIDILFQKSQWKEIKYLEYHVEAKNISLSEWRKTKGSKVNASQQQTEYITKGIDRFLTGHFKDKKGCMLGYLVNGKLDDVVSKINEKIVSKKGLNESINLGTLFINNYQIFESNHSQRKLKHLFFNFIN
tara:strand:- start:333 stop:974 length:642 start_codon:yes stop_codon:yes gene_type:complete